MIFCDMEYNYKDYIVNYKKFLNKYPNDDLVPSVEYELKGLEQYQLQIDKKHKLFIYDLLCG